MKIVLWGVVSVLYFLSPASTQDNGENSDESLERSGQPSAITDTINSGFSPYLESNFGNSAAQGAALSNTPIYRPPLSSTSPLLSSAYANSKEIADSGAYVPSNQPWIGSGANLVNLGTGANSLSSAQVLSDTLSGVPSEAQVYDQAQSHAQAASLAQTLSHIHPHIQAFSETETQALANAQGATTGHNTGSLSGLLPSHELYDQAFASANAQAVTNIGSRTFWRPVPSHEYIRPHQLADGPDIKCRFDGELHHIWTMDYDCMVCVCLQDLSTVCARCNGCSQPLPPLPPQSPFVVKPIQPVTPLPPPPPPKPVATCSPLPSNQAFQNPLNPCQICICKEIIDAFGNPDLNIECEENPQCVLPPEPLPPVPELLTPIPLPICDKFPVDVSFPHPTESCLICKCIAIPVSLMLVKHFTCSLNPLCEPQIVNPTPPPQPMPVPIVPEPVAVSIPELNALPIVTPHPISIPKPLPPSPLAGPSPHESCRPYTPRQPFQHPWDECQICVCSESMNLQRITIEINCYTKPECCIEYAPPSPQPQSLPHFISGASSNAESYANILSSGAQGKVLVDTDANAVANSGYYFNQPNQPGILPSPKTNFVQGGNSFAEASASAMGIQPLLSATRPNNPAVIIPGNGYYSNIPTLLTGTGSSHAVATADASSVTSNGYKPGPPGYYPELSNAQASSESEAFNYGYKKPGYIRYNPGKESLGTSVNSGSTGTAYNKLTLPGYIPGTVIGQSSDANTAANAGQSTFNYLGTLTGQANSQAAAGSEANNIKYSGYNPLSYPGYYTVPGHSGAQTFTEAESSAAANVMSNTGYIKPNHAGYYPVTLQGQTGSLAKAEAEANTYASGHGNVLATSDANAFSSNSFAKPMNFETQAASQANAMATASSIKSGEKCKYEGDLYHEACQACYCHQDSVGDLYSICLGTPCD